jgi:AbrB family looped-hinge helix DNA binding protein
MITTVVTTKGQIIIPSRIRHKLNIRKGTRLSIEEKGDKLVLQPLTVDYFEKMAGILKSKGIGSKTILEERAKEKASEDKKWLKF